MRKRIKTLEQLAKLVDQRRCVVVPSSPPFGKYTPAAVIIYLSGKIILSLFRMGMFEYKRKESRHERIQSRSSA